jgi:hypothetical protein
MCHIWKTPPVIVVTVYMYMLCMFLSWHELVISTETPYKYCIYDFNPMVLKKTKKLLFTAFWMDKISPKKWKSVKLVKYVSFTFRKTKCIFMCPMNNYLCGHLLTWWAPLMEHLTSPSVFSGVRVVQSLVFSVVFCVFFLSFYCISKTQCIQYCLIIDCLRNTIHIKYLYWFGLFNGQVDCK